MAHNETMPADLTIALKDNLEPDEFLSAVRSFFGYVNEIAHALESNDGAVTWHVRVKAGSSLIGLEPFNNPPPSTLSAIYETVRNAPLAIESGNYRSAGISEKAVGHLKVLSEIAERNGDTQSVYIWSKGQAVNISGLIAKKISDVSEPTYTDFGTVEGKLETISDVSGVIKIRIKDNLYAKAIKCVIREDLVVKALQNFRKRVEIEGNIHYRSDGTPISIDVLKIETLPDDSELPSASEVRGILAVA